MESSLIKLISERPTDPRVKEWVKMVREDISQLRLMARGVIRGESTKTILFREADSLEKQLEDVLHEDEAI